MIAGFFHEGSGLGNQLHRYVATRCAALDQGYDFGMYNPELFKGASFLRLDMGKKVELINKVWIEEKITNTQGYDVRPYDTGIHDIKDKTSIDGEFQAFEYFGHRLNEVRAWLTTTPFNRYQDPNTCVINFRGGEYRGVHDLFLPKAYWEKAMATMRRINPLMQFVVHTDDADTAHSFFPGLEVVSDIEKNWKAVRHAHYLILSNSSFAILPALLNEDAKKIIAPLYWAGYMKGYWQLPQNNYKQFTYIHHND